MSKFQLFRLKLSWQLRNIHILRKSEKKGIFEKQKKSFALVSLLIRAKVWIELDNQAQTYSVQ